MFPVQIDSSKCVRDGACVDVCPLGLLIRDGDGQPSPVPKAHKYCLRCGHCHAVCPTGALAVPASCGELAQAAGRREDPAALEQVFRTRRSTRRYRPDAVPRELILRLLDVVRWAPSGTNRQPVNWLVIHNQAEVHRLAAMVAQALRPMPYARRLVEAWDQGRDAFLRGAPHLVVAHAETSPVSPATDCTVALAQLDLLAQAHGLGTCWAGLLMMAMAQSADVRAALELPEGHEAYGALLLGYGAYEYKAVPPREPARVTWR